MSNFFLDANVVLALLWDRHMHSEQARRWFYEDSEEDFFFCRFTQIAVLRLLTTQSVMGNDVRNMAGAWAAWDRLVVDSRVRFMNEPVHIEIAFRSQSRLLTPSPKVWADAYLLAFASLAGLTLVTFDRSLRSRTADVLVL